MDKSNILFSHYLKRISRYLQLLKKKCFFLFLFGWLLFKKLKNELLSFLLDLGKKYKQLTSFMVSHLSFIKKLSGRTIIGIALITFGLVYIFVFLPPSQTEKKTETISEKMQEPITVAQSYEKKSTTPKIVKILIPRLNIDLPVTPAKIINGYWETSDTTASHGSGSANPGEKNNVVIFAHAREGLFYNLKDAKVDDVIYIFTKDKWYSYKIVELKTVYPQQIEVVAPTSKETLTLFTCSGFFDEKRLIVKAYPVETSH